MPKLYHVHAKKKDAAKVLLRYLNCPYLFYKEISIYNKECSKKPVFDGSHIFPTNLYYCTYDDTDIPSEEKLMEDLKKNDYMFSAVAAIDEADEERITISCLGNIKSNSKDVAFLNEEFVLSTISEIDYDTIKKIIDYIEDI